MELTQTNFRRAYHQAYLPIVASANRASTLHYCCNDRDFAWGPLHTQNGATDLLHQRIEGEQTLAPQVLLIDAGCEWNNYASDSKEHLPSTYGSTQSYLMAVTRTTPVGNGGKFTSHARDIYSLVLKMQNVGLSVF
jgi:Xaa-Pro dipeptidase